MANTLTLVGEGLALDWMFTASAVTRPAAWFVALHAGANGGDGSANELVGDGYARQPATFTRAGNVASLAAPLSFGPDTTAPWGSVTDVSVWDSLAGGRCLAQGAAAVCPTCRSRS